MPVPHDPVLLHVGYIKTATTFLQNQVFAGPDEGLELAAGPQTRAQMVQEILLGDDYAFDAEATRTRLEALAADVRARGNLPVWSEEMLLGNPPARRYDGFANARKLQMVYPNAKVLITIRRQPAIALSIYREYVLGGGALPLRGVIGSGDEALSYTPILRPEFLFFDRAIRHYVGLFGAENLLVLPQEMLSADPAAYFAALSQFTGCTIAPDRPRAREHVGEGFSALALRRLSNRFIVKDPTRRGRQGIDHLTDRVIRKLDGVLGRNAKRRRAHEAQIAARYAGLFAQSNRATADLTGLALDALGYET